MYRGSPEGLTLPVPEPKLIQIRTLLFREPLQAAVNVPLVLARKPLEILRVPNSRPELVKLQVWAMLDKGQAVAMRSIDVLTIIVRMMLRVKVLGL